MSFRLTLWSNDPERAAWADAAGVDRIGLDLETLGKADRQSGLATWHSPHVLEDLDRIRPVIRRAELFCRCNPLHDDSAEEIDALVGRGVTVIMLPNFTTAAEVAGMVALIAGRARLVPLVERLAPIEVIPELARLGITEIHVGLNDLSIEAGERNRLALLASPLVDRLAGLAHDAGLDIAIGGLGRAFDSDLPVPSDLVYAQQARLKASGALLARSFFHPQMTADSFAAAIMALRARLDHWFAAPPETLEAARLALAEATMKTRTA